MWYLWFFKNPLGQKVGIVIACAIIAILVTNWYGNGQFENGKRIGITIGDEGARKSMETQWKAKEDALYLFQQQTIAERVKIDKDAAELSKIRLSLNSTLEQIRTTNQHTVEVANETVATIPPSALDGAIRTLSRQLGAPAQQPAHR